MTFILPARSIMLSVAAVALVGAPSVAMAKASKAKPAASASATLVSGKGAARGWARARAVDGKDGLVVTVHGEGLSPGEHGLHIHAVGTCTMPDFASAGGHWNPAAKQHGMENPMGPHEGDLPNLSVGADGKGDATFTVKGAKLKDGPSPALDADGAAIVVHAGPDDYKTDPSGNSGGRVACGVLVTD